MMRSLLARIAAAAMVLLTTSGCDDTTEPVITVVRISAAPDSLLVNDTTRLSAQVLAGTTREVRNPELTWSVSDTAVVTVDASGLVTARSSGSAAVVVSSGGMRDSTVLRVVARDRVIVALPEGVNALTSPSTPVTLHLIGSMPPDRVMYQIGEGGGEHLALFSCDSADRCEFYASGLPEGTSRVIVRVLALGRTLVDSVTVTVTTASLPYRVTFLGTLGESDSNPTDINERGMISGTAFTGTGFSDGSGRAFLYDGARMIDLGTGGGVRAWGEAVNEEGAVAGHASTGENRTCFAYPVLWTLADRAESKGACYNTVQDLSDDGVILARAGTLNLIRGDHVTAIEIPTLTCYGSADRARMNTTGRIAVQVSYGTCKSRGVWVLDGDLKSWICPRRCDLGGINDAGTVVVSAHTLFRHPHELYVWRDGVLTRIGSYNADTNARGINNRSQILALDRGIPLLWSDGRFYEIRVTDPAWVIDDVIALNDAGRIAAHGRNRLTGQVGAVLLEPAS